MISELLITRDWLSEMRLTQGHALQKVSYLRVCYILTDRYSIVRILICSRSLSIRRFDNKDHMVQVLSTLGVTYVVLALHKL